LKGGEIEIIKYTGVYTIFHQENSDGKPSKNKDDNYLKGHYNTEIYRHDSSTLSIYFPTGSSSKSFISKCEEENIKVWEYISSDTCTEAVIRFNENDIHKVHKILHLQIKWKNDQLKELKLRQKKEKEKQKLKEESTESKNNI